jgi:hypothetical protein
MFILKKLYLYIKINKMTIEKIKEYRYLIATFMEEERWLKEVDADLSPYTDFKYHESWDLLMPVITK